MSPQRQLAGPLYESLPALYGIAGLLGLAGGYLLSDISGWGSLALTLAGLAGVIVALVIWLRRRDYRRLQQDYRARDLDAEMGED